MRFQRLTPQMLGTMTAATPSAMKSARPVQRWSIAQLAKEAHEGDRDAPQNRPGHVVKGKVVRRMRAAPAKKAAKARPLFTNALEKWVKGLAYADEIIISVFTYESRGKHGF